MVSLDLKTSAIETVPATVDVDLTNQFILIAASILSQLTPGTNIGSAKLLTGVCPVLVPSAFLTDNGQHSTREFSKANFVGRQSKYLQQGCKNRKEYKNPVTTWPNSHWRTGFLPRGTKWNFAISRRRQIYHNKVKTLGDNEVVSVRVQGPDAVVGAVT